MQLPEDFQADPQFKFQPPVMEDMVWEGTGKTTTPQKDDSNFPREAENDGIQALLDASTPGGSTPQAKGKSPVGSRRFLNFMNEVVQKVKSPLKGKEDTEERPKRNPTRPALYQAVEEAAKEKEMRKKGQKNLTG